MHKDNLNKLYWFFWYFTTIITGILAGFMISHAIMLGRFFTWFVESGNMDLLRSSYSVFRQAKSPQVLYNLFLYIGLISGIIWTGLAYIRKKDRVLATIAGLSTLWVATIFRFLNFDYMEEAVVSGVADEKIAQSYASLNVPLHTLFAIIYSVSIILLLKIALKKKGKILKV